MREATSPGNNTRVRFQFHTITAVLVEALTGKKGTFLLSTLQLEYYCDMIVWCISYRNLFGKPSWTNQWSVVHVRVLNFGAQ